jgi:hypothetical protein
MTRRPAPLTSKVQAIVYAGESPEPDVYDILQDELNAALYQHSLRPAEPVQLRLAIYARKVERLLGTPIEPPQSAAPKFRAGDAAARVAFRGGARR